MLFRELTVVYDQEPHAAALNMAIDEVLLRSARAPLLRIYRWAQPAVSFGYFGKLALVKESWPGRDLVRRWTGGGIVPHGEDVTYSVIVPRDCPFFRLSAAESYEYIHGAVAAALNSTDHTDHTAHLAFEVAPKLSEACFENAVRHDVLVNGSKVAGAAQRRTRHGLLHQGSIQTNGSRAFVTQLGSLLGGTVEERGLEAGELQLAAELAAEKYASADWLERF
jgi:lipoate-protein ligase A